ncbi:uncharacterized protein METZ01_LOCUS365000, partial [marine metagenome]
TRNAINKAMHITDTYPQRKLYIQIYPPI